MKTRFLLMFMVLLLASNVAKSDQNGLGISLRSESNAVFFPFNFGNSIKFEPYFSYYKNAYDSDSGDNDARFSELGFGLFVMNPRSDQSNLYFGARMGYVDGETKSDLSVDEDIDGYHIELASGFEYFIANMFSVGADVSLYYRDLEIEETGGGVSVDTIDETHTGTVTRVIVRYYFN